jgi:hypothetical protein
MSIVIPFIAAAGSYNLKYDTGVINMAEYMFDTPNTIYIGIRNSGTVKEEAYVSVYNGSSPLCSYTWIVNPEVEVDTHCNSMIADFYYVSIQVSSELLIPRVIFNGAHVMNSTPLSVVNYNPGDFAVYQLGKRGKERIRQLIFSKN